MGVMHCPCFFLDLIWNLSLFCCELCTCVGEYDFFSVALLEFCWSEIRVISLISFGARMEIFVRF